jgi:hypothetical protein
MRRVLRDGSGSEALKLTCSTSSKGVITPPFFENRICYWLTDEV